MTLKEFIDQGGQIFDKDNGTIYRDGNTFELFTAVDLENIKRIMLLSYKNKDIIDVCPGVSYQFEFPEICRSLTSKNFYYYKAIKESYNIEFNVLLNSQNRTETETTNTRQNNGETHDTTQASSSNESITTDAKNTFETNALRDTDKTTSNGADITNSTNTNTTEATETGTGRDITTSQGFNIANYSEAIQAHYEARKVDLFNIFIDDFIELITLDSWSFI